MNRYCVESHHIHTFSSDWSSFKVHFSLICCSPSLSLSSCCNVFIPEFISWPFLMAAVGLCVGLDSVLLPHSRFLLYLKNLHCTTEWELKMYQETKSCEKKGALSLSHWNWKFRRAYCFHGVILSVCSLCNRSDSVLRSFAFGFQTVSWLFNQTDFAPLTLAFFT